MLGFGSISGTAISETPGAGAPSTIAVTGTIAATSSFVASLAMAVLAAGTIAATSSIAGTVTTAVPVTGLISAVSSVAGSATTSTPATRFYLSPLNDAPISPAYTDWDQTAGFESTHRGLASLVLLSDTSQITPIGYAAAGENALIGQFISAPLAAQTISGDVKGFVNVNSDSVTDQYPQLRILVVSGDGSVVRGTLLDFQSSFTGDTFPASSGTSVRYPNNWTGSGAALSSVSALDGDRLVIEVGVHATASGDYARATFRIDDSLSDYTTSGDTTWDKNPWIEFDSTLSFSNSIYLSGTISAMSGASGSVEVSRNVSGSISATSTISGTPSIVKAVTGTIAATSTIAGDASVYSAGAIYGTIAATSLLDGTVSVARSISGAISATSTLAGVATKTTQLTGLIAGTSTLAATITITASIHGTIAAVSTLAGSVGNQRFFSGSIAAVSGLSGRLEGGLRTPGSLGINTLAVDEGPVEGYDPSIDPSAKFVPLFESMHGPRGEVVCDACGWPRPKAFIQKRDGGLYCTITCSKVNKRRH